MLVTILAAGTRGDTQPYIALGTALKKRGCRVRLATFSLFTELVQDHGIELYPLPGDLSEVISSGMAGNAMQVDSPLKFLFNINQLRALVDDLQASFYEACSDADVIVYHPGAAIGYFAAQQLNIPSVFAPPFPMTPTRDYPSLIFYDRPRFGRTYNWFTHKALERTMWFASDSAIKQFWKKKFGKLPEDYGCPYPRQRTVRQPTIISCSNYVFSHPEDWPAHVTTTGYWFLEEAKDWNPPNDLLDFLENGAPPVYIGFGSMSDASSAEQTTKQVIEALRISGQRGVLATGWNALARLDEPTRDIFFLESAPHDWLFPRMAAVVHHGGAGTTAAGLRAGIPAVVVPYANDQFAWGRRVYELHAGPKPIPRKQLTSKGLAEAIQDTLRDDIRQSAKELGIKIRNEQGAQVAAEIILRTVNG